MSSASAMSFSGVWPAGSSLPSSSFFSPGEWKLAQAFIGWVHKDSMFSSWSRNWSGLLLSRPPKLQPLNAFDRPLMTLSS